MGRLCEERAKKGRGKRKVERKGQQQGAIEENSNSKVQKHAEEPASTLQRGDKMKDNIGKAAC